MKTNGATDSMMQLLQSETQGTPVQGVGRYAGSSQEKSAGRAVEVASHLAEDSPLICTISDKLHKVAHCGRHSMAVQTCKHQVVGVLPHPISRRMCYQLHHIQRH